VPPQPPRISVSRATPSLERRVEAEEEAAERERQREEKEMRELRQCNMRTRTASAMALPTALAPTRPSDGRLESLRWI
jgi:hypothetical protein